MNQESLEIQHCPGKNKTFVCLSMFPGQCKECLVYKLSIIRNTVDRTLPFQQWQINEVEEGNPFLAGAFRVEQSQVV
jgi:hypothetical protein